MTRREYRELERLRATPVGKSREEIDRTAGAERAEVRPLWLHCLIIMALLGVVNADAGVLVNLRTLTVLVGYLLGEWLWQKWHQKGQK